MDRSQFIVTKHALSYDGSGVNLSHSNNIMARDKTQSHRLHELNCISSHTDPITGNDVMGTVGHPFIVDGILTVYFESDANRDDYMTMLFNRPVLRLGNTPMPEDDRGG